MSTKRTIVCACAHANIENILTHKQERERKSKSHDGLEVHGYILLVKFEVCDLITWYPLAYSKRIYTTHAVTFTEAEMVASKHIPR